MRQFKNLILPILLLVFAVVLAVQYIYDARNKKPNKPPQYQTPKYVSQLTPESEQRLLDEIDKISLKTAVRIKAFKASDNLSLTASKFGGLPYWQPEKPYPTDEKGNKMILLAQINWAEVPHLPDFPEHGILQFFVSAGEEPVYRNGMFVAPNSNFLYGADFDNPLAQKNWRAVYHEQIDENIDKQAVMALDIPVASRDYNLPFFHQYKLDFELQENRLGVAYFPEFKRVLKIAAQNAEIKMTDNDIEEPYKILGDELSNKLFRRNEGHWIGAYPFFTQTAPQEAERFKDYTVLLLQIDTDEENGNDIMWGDAGVGNFFITPDDLKKRDFSRVLYTWDCY
ncbi:MAG: DUF1963 domain-containing protein [Neisseriaceae bacterium]|nr:DUF1963 domain-containing protein [Neisseriaceae bacterium]